MVPPVPLGCFWPVQAVAGLLRVKYKARSMGCRLQQVTQLAAMFQACPAAAVRSFPCRPERQLLATGGTLLAILLTVLLISRTE